MRIYVSVDLEGINGIVHSSQTQPGEPGYERAVDLMHKETNAVITGLIEGGATSILVNDAHWDARNLRIEKLHEKARLISGWQKPYSMMSGSHDAGEKIEAVAFVGYHAMAGNSRGVLSHTYRAQIFNEVSLNGAPVGETALNAFLAGHFGLPVIFLCGDDVVCDEARQLLPGIVVQAVKTAYSRYSAACSPFEENLRALQIKARESIRAKGQCRALKPPSPSKMAITMLDPSMADAAELLPFVRRTGGRTIEMEEKDYSLLFRQMLAVGVLGASRKDTHFH